jgi:hypothetical protein
MVRSFYNSNLFYSGVEIVLKQFRDAKFTLSISGEVEVSLNP